jgi:hypothetical protein
MYEIPTSPYLTWHSRPQSERCPPTAKSGPLCYHACGQSAQIRADGAFVLWLVLGLLPPSGGIDSITAQAAAARRPTRIASPGGCVDGAGEYHVACVPPPHCLAGSSDLPSAARVPAPSRTERPAASYRGPVRYSAWYVASEPRAGAASSPLATDTEAHQDRVVI